MSNIPTLKIQHPGRIENCGECMTKAKHLAKKGLLWNLVIFVCLPVLSTMRLIEEFHVYPARYMCLFPSSIVQKLGSYACYRRNIFGAAGIMACLLALYTSENFLLKSIYSMTNRGSPSHLTTKRELRQILLDQGHLISWISDVIEVINSLVGVYSNTFFFCIGFLGLGSPWYGVHWVIGLLLVATVIFGAVIDLCHFSARFVTAGKGWWNACNLRPWSAERGMNGRVDEEKSSLLDGVDGVANTDGCMHEKY